MCRISLNCKTCTNKLSIIDRVYTAGTCLNKIVKRINPTAMQMNRHQCITERDRQVGRQTD
uniref:Uncharacterized protein n=1 Tax=Anguilla anguilla TaxID=7936 RepID=A0A0E9T6H3_ANGAN